MNILQAFQNHFGPRRNIIYDRCLFHTRFQLKVESREDIIIVLHSMAQDCGLTTGFQSEVNHDHVVVGIKDKALPENWN